MSVKRYFIFLCLMMLISCNKGDAGKIESQLPFAQIELLYLKYDIVKLRDKVWFYIQKKDIGAQKEARKVMKNTENLFYDEIRKQNFSNIHFPFKQLNSTKYFVVKEIKLESLVFDQKEFSNVKYIFLIAFTKGEDYFSNKRIRLEFISKEGDILRTQQVNTTDSDSAVFLLEHRANIKDFTYFNIN